MIPNAQPVAGKLLEQAVARLLGGGKAPASAVTRFIADAAGMGIDLDLLAAVVDPNPAQHTSNPRAAPIVRQACMPVLGAGRTVMLFVSGPGSAEIFGESREQARERTKAIRQAIVQALAADPEKVRLVQALAEPGEDWAIEAYLLAGMQRIAELVYLSRPLALGEATNIRDTHGKILCADGQPWPQGVVVRPLRSGGSDAQALSRALEASYEGTLDCPELAGMRSTEDIIDSHRAVGEYDPAFWWIIKREDEPLGCVLLNRCPDPINRSRGCVELVYIGISPKLRGMGLGKRLLGTAIAASASLERSLRCALDTRNTPAQRMYDRARFVGMGRRIAFVGLAADIVSRKS